MADEQSGAVMPDGATISGDSQETTTQGSGSAVEPANDHQPADQQSTSESSGTETEATDWKTEATKWKELARKHERRQLDALGLKPGELDQLRTDAGRTPDADRLSDAEAATAEARSSLVTERLHTKLARAGMSEGDAEALIAHIDTNRLLADGKPSEEAIDQVAGSLTRSLGRASSVDADQGQRSAEGPFSADAWLRNKARS